MSSSASKPRWKDSDCDIDLGNHFFAERQVVIVDVGVNVRTHAHARSPDSTIFFCLNYDPCRVSTVIEPILTTRLG